MIWIVLVLSVLCIAMSCVALRYRKDWLFEQESRRMIANEWRTENNKCLDLELRNNELCDLLNTMEKDYNELLHQLPKRDSKGRYCKK
jgi:Tfp pilus assembly protein PilO